MSVPGVEERVTEVGEYKVNAASAGKGPALVMLHGEGRRASWRDWEGFLGLADAHRLVVPDLVGFGGSSRPAETPDYRVQARVVHELLDLAGISKATLVGYSWGGQVALEAAIEWPDTVEAMVLVASTYDKGQLPNLGRVRKPTLLVWAEDDLLTQVKAGYLLRDAIRTSRLEVLPPVAKDPRHDFTIAHNLLVSRSGELLESFRSFLASPSTATAEPPEMEKELRGMALKTDSDRA